MERFQVITVIILTIVLAFFVGLYVGQNQVSVEETTQNKADIDNLRTRLNAHQQALIGNGIVLSIEFEKIKLKY